VLIAVGLGSSSRCCVVCSGKKALPAPVAAA
jgi:hypothetical protein